MIKFVADTHTHSISSGHAYSTVQEMAKEAAVNGIRMFALTDHAPSMLGAPQRFHFVNLGAIPRQLYGVTILRGAEVNILDFEGTVDLPQGILKRLDYVIASLHDVCIAPGTVEQNTRAAIAALENPFVDALGHPGNPVFPVDIGQVVQAAKENGKLIEINNHSFNVRTGSMENCREFVRECKRQQQHITTSSDAHISFDVGRLSNVAKLLEEEDFPEELVMTTSVEKMADFVYRRRGYRIFE